ncbi:type IV pilus biogenesis/stability protein PilW [Vibrio sp. H11]|uniref:type IV pilus biogenesis/stability protein PilW n=1 Tax=Vibrio sp. H11 TaxID=2565928 RepID=UPI0010A67336|nr:type IV pilus biogenesis/stability protein PilW [Vibrio sp. H11]
MQFKQLMLVGIITTAGCVTVTDIPDNHPQAMADSRIDLGLGYLSQGNMNKARENLYRAARHAPDYARSQLALAHYLDQVGETEKARHVYLQARLDHPENGDVLNNFGTFLCKHGDYLSADTLFNQALQRPGYNQPAATLENAALCANKSGNQKQAIHYLDRSLDYDPSQASAWLALTRMQLAAGNTEDARNTLRGFSQRFGNPKAVQQLWLEVNAAWAETQKNQR